MVLQTGSTSSTTSSTTGSTSSTTSSTTGLFMIFLENMNQLFFNNLSK